MGGQGQAQIAQAAGDEIGRLPADPFVPGGEVVAYHDLADVAAFEHVAEGVPGGIHGKDAPGYGRVVPVGKTFHDGGEDAAHLFLVLLAQFFEVDDVVFDIVTDGRHLCGRAQVGLADLDETAAFRQAAHAAVGQLAGEEIEDHMHALSARGREDPGFEGRGARGEDMLYAHGAQQGPFAFRARCGKDDRAACPGDLDGGKAHAPCGRVQQHSFAGLEARRMDERLPGGHEDSGDHRGVGERHAFRYGGRKGFPGIDMGGEGAVHGGEDPVAGTEAGHALTNGGDRARAVEHQGPDLVGHAHGYHDVLEVHAVGFGRDLDLAGPGKAPLQGGDPDVLDARAAKIQMVGLRFGTGQRGAPHLPGGRQAAHQTGGQQAAAAQGQLVFLVPPGGQQPAQGGELGLGSGHGVHVDDERRDVAQFVGHGLFQAPEQALRGDGLIRSAGGLGLAGQHGQTHGRAVLLRRQSLGQMQECLGRMLLEGSLAVAAPEIGLVAVQSPEEHDAPGRAVLPPVVDQADEGVGIAGIDGSHAVGMSRTGAGHQCGRSALLFQRAGKGAGKIRIAAGQDEPVPGSVPGLRHQGLAPDHVIA